MDIFHYIGLVKFLRPSFYKYLHLCTLRINVNAKDVL